MARVSAADAAGVSVPGEAGAVALAGSGGSFAVGASLRLQRGSVIVAAPAASPAVAGAIVAAAPASATVTRIVVAAEAALARVVIAATPTAVARVVAAVVVAAAPAAVARVVIVVVAVAAAARVVAAPGEDADRARAGAGQAWRRDAACSRPARTQPGRVPPPPEELSRRTTWIVRRIVLVWTSGVGVADGVAAATTGRGDAEGRAMAAAATPPRADSRATARTRGVRRLMPHTIDFSPPSPR